MKLLLPWTNMNLDRDETNSTSMNNQYSQQLSMNNIILSIVKMEFSKAGIPISRFVWNGTGSGATATQAHLEMLRQQLKRTLEQT